MVDLTLGLLPLKGVDPLFESILCGGVGRLGVE